MRRGAVFCAAFCAAVFWAVYILPAGCWLWLGLAALVPAGFFLWRKRTGGVLVALGVAAALLWCAAYRLAVFAPAEALDGRRTQVTVLAAELPSPTDYGYGLPCYLVGEGLPVRGMVYGGEELEAVRPGDTLTFTADCVCRTYREDGVSNLASKGTFLTLRVRGEVQTAAAGHVPWWALPLYWGRQLADRVGEVFPEDVSGFLAAMVAGERGGVSDSDYTALKRSGVAHLLAVSGTHVCFLVGFLTLLTGNDPRRRAAVCLPVVVLFALMVGGSPSVLRSCVIWAFALLAPVVGRENDPWSALAAALALLLLWNPLSAANVGLQLSFAAVAGITLTAPKLSGVWSRLRLPQPSAGRGKQGAAKVANGLLKLLWSVFASTLGALVFTVPLTAYYFGTLSLAAPLTNLLVMPVAAVVFALGLVTGLTAFVFPGGAAALAQVLAWPARYVLAVARGVSAFPYSAVTLAGSYYPAFLLCAYALLLMAVLWRGQRRRWWIFVGSGGAVLLTAVVLTRLTFVSGDLALTVLDVGQGQCVALRSEGETALIDCGGNSAADPGDVAADYLLNMGEEQVDKLILTHYHDDHTNGLATLFDRVAVNEVILPQMDHDPDRQLWVLELAAAEGAEVTWIEGDETIPLGGASLQVFAPLGSGEANEEGLSVLASAGDFDALVTGDMGTTVEERLVRYHDLPRCEVLVAGHHGSAGSNGETLLNAVRPQTVLISVGRNSYGHPASQTLDRLAAVGADIYRTDQRGHVTVTANAAKEGG